MQKTMIFICVATLSALIAPASAMAQGGQKADPAGGAAIGEVILATAMATVVTVVALLVVIGHRSGRVKFVARAADHAERLTGVPGWASLPNVFVGGALLVAVIGMYWDISLHIDNGRDPGPLANPAHYLILFGLFGIFIAGLLSMALPEAGEKPSPTSVRLTNDWYAPLGAVLMTACAGFALTGFPLDDIWHRLFGQDVTLWGPTHLMLIGGASLATLAAAILIAEGARAATASGREPNKSFPIVRRAMLAGAFLVGLSTVQAEFDFSVPQFRLLYHPVLLMVAASIALVTARMWIGRGGALMALFGFLAIRGLLTVLVGGIWGQTTPHFPLYAAEAICVELVALAITTRRPVLFGAVSGVAIGTVGLAAEWGWSHVWMTMSWPTALLPEAIIFGLLAAVSGGVLGGAIGRALAPPAEDLAPSPRWAVSLAGVGLIVAVAFPLPISAPGKVTAQLKLTDAQGPPQRRVNAEVRLTPPDAADNAEWFKSTSWQGGGSVVGDMREVSPGVYRTTEPIPVYGNWKATLRLHKGDVVAGLPIFLPEDPAIPAKEVPAEPSMTRAFVLDKKNLQREQKQGVPGFLTTLAYLVVLAIVIGIVSALTIGLRRMDRDREERRPRPPPPQGAGAGGPRRGGAPPGWRRAGPPRPPRGRFPARDRDLARGLPLGGRAGAAGAPARRWFRWPEVRRMIRGSGSWLP